MRTSFLVVVVLALVLVGLLAMRSLHDREGPNQDILVMPTVGQEHAESSAVQGSEAGAPSAAASSPTSASPQSADELPGADPKLALAAARNMLDFVERFEPLAQTDPAAALAVARAFEECLVVAVPTRTLLIRSQAEIHGTPPASVESFLARSEARCRDFVQARKVDGEAYDRRLDHAASVGSLEAQALRLTQTMFGQTPEFIRSEVQRLLSSGDPAVVAALNDALALFAFHGVFQPNSLLSELRGQDWVGFLTACHLGYDCSARSPIIQYACRAGYRCDFESVDALLRFNHGHPAVELQNQIATRLADAIRNQQIGHAMIGGKGPGT